MLSKLISLFSHYGDAVLTPFLISFPMEHATGPVPHNPGFSVVCPTVRGSHSTGKAAHPEQWRNLFSWNIQGSLLTILFRCLISRWGGRLWGPWSQQGTKGCRLKTEGLSRIGVPIFQLCYYPHAILLFETYRWPFIPLEKKTKLLPWFPKPCIYWALPSASISILPSSLHSVGFCFTGSSFCPSQPLLW